MDRPRPTRHDKDRVVPPHKVTATYVFPVSIPFRIRAAFSGGLVIGTIRRDSVVRKFARALSVTVWFPRLITTGIVPPGGIAPYFALNCAPKSAVPTSSPPTDTR